MTLLFAYATIAIGISFICSLFEAIILSLSHSYIQVLKKERPNTGALLGRLKDNIDVSLASILILNTISHTAGAAGVGAEAVKIFGDASMFYVSAVWT